MTSSYDLQAFIQDMTHAVSEYSTDEARLAATEPLVAKLIQTADWLSPEHQQPCATAYARHTLYEDPEDRFEILALVWQPGQRTPIHDHDGTWGVEGVLSGLIQITNYVRTNEESQGVIQLRQTDSSVVGKQSVSNLLPPADCHVIEHFGAEPTITIHVYGKKLRAFKVFDPTDKEDTYVVRNYVVACSDA